MLIKLFCIFGYLQLLVTGLTNPSCDEVEEKVADADKNTVVVFPPSLPGKWVSEKCETRTLIGPEYLLRSMRYSDNETYTALIHRYRDPSCTQPWLSTSSRGRAALRGRSWLATSAAQADFTLESVVIVAHSQKAADDVSSSLNSSCAGIIKGKWKPHTDYTIFISAEGTESSHIPYKEDRLTVNLDCLKNLRLPQSEAGLLRVQVRPPGPPEPSVRRMELLIGEAKPKGTFFHTPLLFLSQTVGCEVCSSVDRSTLRQPPRLAAPSLVPLSMAGEWVSTRCETRPMGLFLKRKLRVSGKSWQAEFKFHQDVLCSSPTLTASAEGALTEVTRRRIPGAIDYDFRVIKAFLTLHDEGLVKSLSQDPTCGPSTSWQLGVRKDLTPAKGCPALGIAVPTTEHELVRLELDPSGQALLYLGQTETRTSDKKQRPNSYQPPLLQCNAPELPPLTHFLNSFNGATRACLALPLGLAVILII